MFLLLVFISYSTAYTMIEIHKADDTHAGIVGYLLELLFQEVGHTPEREEIEAIFPNIEEDDNHLTLLAWNDDGEPVGIITVAESLALYAGGWIGVINELYVIGPYRSEGVGKMLIDEVKEIAEMKGWKRLEVTTPGEDYQRTIRFYEREGFHTIGPRMKCEF